MDVCSWLVVAVSKTTVVLPPTVSVWDKVDATRLSVATTEAVVDCAAEERLANERLILSETLDSEANDDDLDAREEL